MKTLTWADFAKHEPCYNPADKYGEFEGTILDLMQHPDIPAKDKLWAFKREGIANDKTLRLFAVACARRVQHLMKDQRSIDALDVAERYANGEATENELAAARNAAEDAARAARNAAENAAADAAWAAANAARNAAENAAWYAARAARNAAENAAAAARDAAWYAAGDAAENAARQAQVEIAIELLTKLK